MACCYKQNWAGELTEISTESEKWSFSNLEANENTIQLQTIGVRTQPRSQDEARGRQPLLQFSQKY